MAGILRICAPDTDETDGISDSLKDEDLVFALVRGALVDLNDVVCWDVEETMYRVGGAGNE